MVEVEIVSAFQYVQVRNVCTTTYYIHNVLQTNTTLLLLLLASSASTIQTDERRIEPISPQHANTIRGKSTQKDHFGNSIINWKDSYNNCHVMF